MTNEVPIPFLILNGPASEGPTANNGRKRSHHYAL